jgi:Flp pilus assembly protein TadG
VRQLVHSRKSGQALVLVALLLPVLIGCLALVIDLGMAMSQVRALQNAADAGVMAGTRLLAGSVTQSQGTVAYAYTTNQQVQDRVDSLVAPNRLVTAVTFTYATAVQFRDCSGASLGFTASSDATLVASLGGTRLGSTSMIVPNNTCSLKVNTQVTFPSYFAQVLGYPTQTVAAQAVARVAPTTPPTQYTGVWPISHWTEDTSIPCPDQVGSLCTFWDSNSAPGGNFKEVIDMSRLSELSVRTQAQLWRIDYDHRWPGNLGKNVDVPEWIRHGWQGTVFVDEFDSRCLSASLALTCPNSKFEIYGGDMGNNIADMMRGYISDPANLEGTDPVRGQFASVNVFFWRFGEQNIMTTPTVWSGPNNPNTIQRIILHKIRRFRFYTTTVDSSHVQGYFVSIYTPGVPQNGPPSTVANTVVMSE